MRHKKGLVHTDYIIAIGIFVLIFGLLVTYTTGFLQDMRDTSQITRITSNALSLLSIADFSFHPQSWPETQPDSSTVLLFHFTANATTAEDSSGRRNNGTVSGAVWNASGKFGAAFSFDDAGDYIEIQGSGDFNFSTEKDFTIAAWVHSNTTGNRYVVSRMSGNIRFQMQVGTGSAPANKAQCLANDSINQAYINSVDAASDGLWHHIACVFDRDGNITVYVDGSSSGAASMSSIGNLNMSAALRIGDDTGTGSAINGTIDEVVIYNRSLSQEEILNLSQPERRLDKIGLLSHVYRFTVIVNNTASAYRNQSLSVSNLPDEVVSVNLSNILPAFNINSVNVYDPDNNTVPYQKQGNNITFVTNINANTAKIFVIYVDDDGIYEDRSTTVSGTDNLTETVIPYEEIEILDYQNIRNINGTNYTLLRDATGGENFNVTLYDTNSSSDVISFGTTVPRRGDVVALQRFFAYLNSTAGIRPGRITVRTW